MNNKRKMKKKMNNKRKMTKKKDKILKKKNKSHETTSYDCCNID
jgi:hypothetical protein